MDSKVRQSRHHKFPPPLYLASKDSHHLYCKSCGRVNTSRRNNKTKTLSNLTKYCSDRCRRNKLRPIDLQVGEAFMALLDDKLTSYLKKYGADTSSEKYEIRKKLLQQSGKKEKRKGDQRIIVWCSEVQALVFGHEIDLDKKARKNKNRVTGSLSGSEKGRILGIKGQDYLNTAAIQLQECLNDLEGYSQSKLDESTEDLNLYTKYKELEQLGLMLGRCDDAEGEEVEKVTDIDEMIQRRKTGHKIAEEREVVRRAARRAVVFGIFVDGLNTRELNEKPKHGKMKVKKVGISDVMKEEICQHENVQKSTRKCEAVTTQSAIVIEPSFAKGDWGIRWRENI